MFRRAFTLIEIMVAVIILGILVTIGIPSYQNFVEDSKSRVCHGNLITLKTALDVYVNEKGVVPADLSLIPAGYIDRTYARCVAEGGWRLKLAVAVTAMDELGKAYADMITELAAGRLELLRCPKDTSNTGRSYGVFSPLIDMSAEQYRLLKGKPVPFIADIPGTTSTGTFSESGDLALRHRTVKFAGSSDQYANVIFNNGVIASVKRGGDIIKVTYGGRVMTSLTQHSPDIDSGSYAKMTSVLNKSLGRVITDVFTVTRAYSSGGSSNDTLNPDVTPPTSTSTTTDETGKTSSYTTVYSVDQAEDMNYQTATMVAAFQALSSAAVKDAVLSAAVSAYKQTAEDAKAKSAEALNAGDYAGVKKYYDVALEAFQAAEKAVSDAKVP